MAYFECIIGGASGGNILTVTCNERFAGLPITCTKGIESYTQTCPSASPYTVQFEDLAAGTWTISGTIGSSAYSTTVNINDSYTTELDAGFSWEEWLTLGGLDPTDYNSLDEVLADEKALRRLMTIHASVDYMCENDSDTETLETILENDLAAKWINLRDYALDSLYAVPAIATIMDSAGKYGYGEWALVPQVPTMTSNTTPYGEAFSSTNATTSSVAWKAFDGSTSTEWHPVASASNNYVGYHFETPIAIKRIQAVLTFGSGAPSRTFKIQGSNNGQEYTELGTFTASASTTVNVDINTESTYSYLRLFCEDSIHSSGVWAISVNELQFYAWQPKGCVPVMTSNTTPYGVASATSEYDANRAAYNVFNPSNMNWVAASGNTTNAGVSITLPTPFCATKFTMLPMEASNTSTSNGCRVKDYKIQGSDYGANWTDLYSGTYTIGSGLVEADINNTTYYKYYRLLVVNEYTSQPIGVNHLQFYGRSLNVSVPVMTSDTAPFYSLSGIDDTSHKLFHAFDGDGTTFWNNGSGNQDGYLIVDFGKSVKIGKVEITPRYINSHAMVKGFTVEASNDGTEWETVITGTHADSANAESYSISANAYRYWKLKKNGNNYYDSTIQVVTLQFYGVDYSEREFETGSTMKYLYDHGLELETLEVSKGSITTSDANLDDMGEIYMPLASSSSSSSTSNFICVGVNIDLSGYSLMRAHAGTRHVPKESNNVAGALRVWASKPIGTFGTPDATAGVIIPLGDPNTVALDISSFNQSKFIDLDVVYTNGRVTSFNELWLE